MAIETPVTITIGTDDLARIGVEAPRPALSWSLADTGTVGVAASGSIVNTGELPATWSIAQPSGLAISPASGTLAAGGTQALTATASAAASYVLTLVSAGSDIVGNTQTFVASAVAATAFTITLAASSGATGSPVDVIVTPTGGPLAGAATVSLSCGTGTLGTTSLSFASGATAAQTTTMTPDSDGAHAVAMTNTLGLLNTGNPASYNSSTAVAPSGTIVQYLTHDGDLVGNSVRSSAPTRNYWNNCLQFPWRRGTLGDWLDSTLAENGASAYASFGPLAATGLFTATVTALVARWLANGLNRGFYLRTRVDDFAVRFAGRTYATSGSRPALVVVTSAGTFTLPARCNATWNTSTANIVSGSADWTLLQGSQPAILQFDLATVTGTLVSATLQCTLVELSPGHTTAMVDVFEADPPTIIVPEVVASPTLGLAAAKASFADLAADGAVIFSDDMATPGFADAGWGYTGAPGDQYTPTRGTRTDAFGTTTYARGAFRAGDNGSADIKVNVSVGGAAPHYPPNVVREELFGQYHLYLDPDFGTTEDTAIKIPAMGVQFGYWNPVGYWASTTGNGGSQGTGLRVTRGDGVYEYQGHSVRITTGVRPADSSAYDGYFAVAFYPYNLDQGGPFPAGESWPYVAIRTGQWYCLDLRVKQNTMSGAQDADGNYATANADGVLQAWVNGYQVYLKNTFRWRKHAEFGVQGLWIDFYHGGTPPANAAMHYRIDRVTVATAYIGPPVAPLPSWVPAPDTMAVFTSGGGVLTNNFRATVDPYYSALRQIPVANAYSCAVPNPYLGTYGGLLFFGSGHAASNCNQLVSLQLGASTMSFVSMHAATPWFGSGTDGTTQENNGVANATGLIDATYGDAIAAVSATPVPASAHTYTYCGVLPPGAAAGTMGDYGTFYLPFLNGYLQASAANLGGAHYCDLRGLTAAANVWSRASSAVRVPANTVAHAVYVPAQNRHYETWRADTAVRWTDHSTTDATRTVGTGVNFDMNSDDPSNGVLLHVPDRGLNVMLTRVGGVLKVQWMDVSVAQPTMSAGGGGTAALSASIALPPEATTAWADAFWCPDNSKIIVGRAMHLGSVDHAAMQEIEIPATLTDPWPVTRRPFTVAVGTFAWPLFTPYWQAFRYLPAAKCAVLLMGANEATADAVATYRPHGT